ncbi:MAG: NAD(P)-binding domain-containing protein [Rhodobacterales bacterium]|nr:NAD(P)-binding domain-containing protein [Rhodobacterales bacterium]
MKLAIIGLGRVGQSLAKGWSETGHILLLGTRDTSDPKATTLASQTGGTLLPPAEAAAQADVVVLALPWPAAEAATKALGDLAGKIVIDCMNPLGMIDGLFGLTIGHTTSGAETLAGWLPGAKVVKTLNQVGAEIMADNTRLPHRPVMFMAGDDDSAKASVAALLTALGFDPQDAGDLTKARILEPFALVWINQALRRGNGRNWAFAAVSQP